MSKGELCDGTKPMIDYVFKDESTRQCPCGDQITWWGIEDKLEKWIEKHRPHSNGRVKFINCGSQ